MESIRSKLISAFLMVIIFLVITAGFFVVANFIIIKKYEIIMDNMVSEYELIDKTQETTDSFNNLIKYIRNQERMDTYINNKYALQNLLIKLDSAIDDEESFATYIGLRNTISSLLSDADTGIEMISIGRYSEINKYYDSVNDKNDFVKTNTSILLLKQLEIIKELRIEMIDLRWKIELGAVLVFLIVILFSILYAIKISGKIIYPLSKLTWVAKTISGGNLDAPIDERLLKGNDETSSLTESFLKMLSYLKDNIAKLKEYNVEIKDSRNHLRLEKKKLQQYLDVAGIFVMTFDFENRIIMLNKKGKEILGVAEDEAVGRDWVASYVVKDDRVKTRSMLNFIIGGVSPIDTLENSIIGLDKNSKNIVWHFSLLKDDNGLASSILGTGVDVTELSKAKTTINQLKEVDKLKNEVLNIATHELKTPLISIVGLSEVMQKNPKTMPDDYKEYVSIINSEGGKLSRLIKSMLAASRNEIGKITINKEDVIISELEASIKTSLEILAKRTESKILIKNDVADLKIESDREKISQVIYNFVDNAVKYGPKGQSILLSFEAVGGDIKISVHGEGEGIDKDLQKKLFIKFSQLEPSLSRSQDGMGLGLYICKQNIEALGGKIGVVSELGKGATFFFTLPLNNNLEAKK